MKCNQTLHLSDICDYVKDKIAIAALNRDNYISTENMLANKAGIVRASSLPATAQTQAFLSGDVLVSNIRPYFKKIWFAKFDGGCSNDVLVFRAKEGVDSRFLYYVLANDTFFAYSTATSKGTKMPRGDKTAIMGYEVPKITPEEQNKITAILSSLDDKIELNNKINANLEQQAQALFKAWFDENSLNSKGTLGDIAAITMGQSPSGNSYNEDGKGTVFYQGRSEFGFRFPTRRLFTTEPKRMAKTGDLLLSVRAPVGDLNVAYETCCIGRGLCALHSKDNMNSFLLYALRSLKPTLDVFNGEGSVFGSISRDDLIKIPVSIPCVDDMARFETTVRPMDDLIRANYKANCRLQFVRDKLLPKLMSGEII